MKRYGMVKGRCYREQQPVFKHLCKRCGKELTKRERAAKTERRNYCFSCRAAIAQEGGEL